MSLRGSRRTGPSRKPPLASSKGSTLAGKSVEKSGKTKSARGFRATKGTKKLGPTTARQRSRPIKKSSSEQHPPRVVGKPQDISSLLNGLSGTLDAETLSMLSLLSEDQVPPPNDENKPAQPQNTEDTPYDFPSTYGEFSEHMKVVGRTETEQHGESKGEADAPRSDASIQLDLQFLKQKCVMNMSQKEIALKESNNNVAGVTSLGLSGDHKQYKDVFDLTAVDLSNCQLANVAQLHFCHQLVRVYLNHNCITDEGLGLDQWAGCMPNLRVLSLSHNRLTRIPDFRGFLRGALDSAFESLAVLDLSYNDIDWCTSCSGKSGGMHLFSLLSDDDDQSQNQSVIRRLPANLQSLDLTGNPMIESTDNESSRLLPLFSFISLPKLRYLNRQLQEQHYDSGVLDVPDVLRGQHIGDQKDGGVFICDICKGVGFYNDSRWKENQKSRDAVEKLVTGVTHKTFDAPIQSHMQCNGCKWDVCTQCFAHLSKSMNQYLQSSPQSTAEHVRQRKLTFRFWSQLNAEHMTECVDNDSEWKEITTGRKHRNEQELELAALERIEEEKKAIGKKIAVIENARALPESSGEAKLRNDISVEAEVMDMKAEASKVLRHLREQTNKIQSKREERRAEQMVAREMRARDFAAISESSSPTADSYPTDTPSNVTLSEDSSIVTVTEIPNQ